MFIIKYYLAGAIVALALAAAIPNWYFSAILIWTSISLLGVSGAYIFDKPSVFRKRSDGTIPSYISWVFFPFLLGAQVYNSWARKTDTVPTIQEISPGIYLACRLFPSDIDFLKKDGVGAILDATSEFSGLNWSAHDDDLAYKNVPILDHKTPHTKDLQEAIHWIENQVKNNKGVVIHCALGRGRSVLITAAYLLAKGIAPSVDKALAHINEIRGTARLNDEQYKKLAQLHAQGNLSLDKSILLVVNPVSGGGSWERYSEAIKECLSRQYQLTVIETTKQRSARQVTKDNMSKGFTIIAACGGDGTVNEVASQLVNTEQKMAIIPLGTTNALAHVLFGIKSKLNPFDVACDIILDGQSRAIDTAVCNDDIVLLLAGLGFEQKMIEEADREKKNEKGQFAYINALINAIEENELHDLELYIDDEEPIKKKLSSLIVANAAPFSTMLAQGGTSPDIKDGKLDMTTLDTSNSRILPLISIGASTLRPDWMSKPDVEGLEHRLISKITIKSTSIINYVIDGEIRQSENVTIKVNPASLNVMVTQKTND